MAVPTSAAPPASGREPDDTEPAVAAPLRGVHVALAAVVPLVAGVLALVLQRPDGPVLFSDELGYLGIAQDLSGSGQDLSLAEIHFYSPGYGMLLAPVLALFRPDPWFGAVLLNLAALAALGPALLALVRRAVATPPAVATAAAIAVAALPVTVLQVPRAWPEVVISLVYVLWATALLGFVRRPALAPAMLVVALAWWSFLLHRRASVLVIVTVVALLWWTATRLRDRGAPFVRRMVDPGVAFVFLVAGHVAQDLLHSAVRARLYPGVDASNVPDRVQGIIGDDFGQRLYSTAWSWGHVSAGLVVVGAFVLLTRIRHGDDRVWSALVVLGMGGSLLLGVAVIADGPRVDHLLYERYVAPMGLPVAALGAARLGWLAHRSRLALAAIVSLPAATAVLAVAVDGDRFDGDVQKLAVPTLSSVELLRRGAGAAFVGGVTPLVVTVAVTAVLGVAVAVGRARPVAGLGVLVAASLIVTAAGSWWSLRPFLDFWEPQGRDLAAAVEAAGLDGPIGWDEDTPRPLASTLQYRLGYPGLRELEGDRCPDDVAVVVTAIDARPSWPATELARDEAADAILLVPTC